MLVIKSMSASVNNNSIIDSREAQNADNGQKYPTASELVHDVEYICGSTKLIVDSLRNGNDVAQLPNGDVMVTEVKVVHMHYVWNEKRKKMTRVS